MLADWSFPGKLVLCGVCEREGDSLYNSAVLFGDGQHIITYRKIHLFDDEFLFFKHGIDEPPVISFKGHNYGIMLCFDWIFPEISRVLAIKKSQIILHPANLVLPYCQDSMQTRSIENRIYTATANRTGQERGLNFTGMSQITAPSGQIIIRTDNEYSGIISADVDLNIADNKMVTKNNNIMKDRKPYLYRRLCVDQ
jgi:predicted amidohydrolase